MSLRSYNLNIPSNPFLQVLYFIAGGVLLIVAILMSAVVLAVAMGVALVFGLIFFVRVWWLKRQLSRTGRGPGGPAGPGRRGVADRGASDEVLEVDYTVVDERDEPRRRS
jgi:hypothetical protein